METTTKQEITVQTTVNAPVDKVWKFWSEPEHVTKWYFASDDWHAPRAKNDLRVAGNFVTRMEAKDGSMGFDFGGTYTRVERHKAIDYTMDDDRKVRTTFSQTGNQTHVVQTFEAERTHPIEIQRGGWQAILDNFKKYVEAN